MVGIRHVRDAATQRVVVNTLSQRRKPRHVDSEYSFGAEILSTRDLIRICSISDGLIAMSYLYRERDHMAAEWLTTEDLQETLVEELPGTLGPQFRRIFEKMLPQLEAAEMIRFNDNETKFQVTRRMAKIMLDAAAVIEAETFPSKLEEHYAHCDYIRRKTSKIRRTIKACEDEIAELKAEKEIWRYHQRTCPLIPSTARGTSAASDASFSSEHVEEEDASMEEPPIAGPSSFPETTPARRPHVQNPADAYMTPESLPRRRGSTREQSSPQTSPSRPGPRASFSLSFHDETNGENMELVNGKVAGPSRTSSQIELDNEVATRCAAFENELMGRLATQLKAPKPTYQSIQETVEEILKNVFMKEAYILLLEKEIFESRREMEQKVKEV
ncbi:hypothetical protein H0H81_003598 [Sphagnurus paluster]|uniref:Uncharacterized protein n=1 Tax=Sphagnurus paluster TaxID=117069 RepID=A0A9P7FSC2_9AGAR|nr:hypothetical protein H0H81_003598 [Sphagnurus paluster]